MTRTYTDSQTAYNVGDSNFFRDDYPIIIPKNMLRDSIDIQLGEFATYDDQEDSDYPIEFAISGHNGHYAKTDSSEATPDNEVYGDFDTTTAYGTTDSNGDYIGFDTLFFNIRPTDAIVQNITLTLYDTSKSYSYIQDSSFSSTPTRNLYPLRSGTSDTSPYSLAYGTFYYKLDFDMPTTPSYTYIDFLEVFVGRRIQLYKKPKRPFDYARSQSTRKTFESNTGIQTNYLLGRSQRHCILSFETSSDTDMKSLQKIWTETNYGSHPIVFCEKPYTQPEKAGLFYIVSKKLGYSLKSALHKTVTIELMEQGPTTIDGELY